MLKFSLIFMLVSLLSYPSLADVEHDEDFPTHPMWPLLLAGGVVYGVSLLDEEEQILLAGLGFGFILWSGSRVGVTGSRSNFTLHSKGSISVLAFNHRF